MKKWLLVLGLVTTGCSSPLINSNLPTPPRKIEVREGVLQPERSVNQLLIERLALCNDPPANQEVYLNRVVARAAPSRPGNRGDEEKLNALLLASCKPARTPGVLNQLLADLTAAGTWPEEYAAFFDLLIAGQRAYATVEKVYMDLKQEHEKTIQGLSEIEAQIELQSAETGPE